MKKHVHLAAVALILSGLSSAPALADAYDDGVKAYQSEQYAQALELLTPAAQNGNAEAAFLLGEMYGPRSWGMKGENRNGVEQDNALAVEWWSTAARAGHAQAQLKLGWFLMHGQDVVAVDEKAGMEWLLKAAEQGVPHAQYEAGIGFWKGKGVPQDLVQAYLWLSLASAKDGFEGAGQYLDEASKGMTPEQIAEGKKLAEAWKPKG